MSAQAIHILALIVLFPATVASFALAGAALRFRGAFGVTWRTVLISSSAFLLLASALVYVLYNPHALPQLLSGVVLPPNPFKVS